MIALLKRLVIVILLFGVSIVGLLFMFFLGWIHGLLIWFGGAFLIWYIQRHYDKKRCSRCAEWVKKEAMKCRYCGSEFPDEKTKSP